MPNPPVKEMPRQQQIAVKAAMAAKNSRNYKTPFKMKGSKLSPVKKKDACYYKAKRAHKVFPSAYASGMIAKCRKNS